MCWEKLTERDEGIDVRATEAAREEDLERSDVWTATVAAPDEAERADELARV